MTGPIVNLWQGSEYSSDSGHVRVLNLIGYIQYTAASGIFKTPGYLERFLLWHIKGYLGIFWHCSEI